MNNYFEKFNKKVDNLAAKVNITIRKGINSITKPLQNNDGWGKDEVIAIAITLMIAGLIMIPQLKTFAGSVMTEVTGYFNSMKTKIFDTTL